MREVAKHDVRMNTRGIVQTFSRERVKYDGLEAVDGCGVRAPKKERPAKGGPFFTGSQHVQAIFTSICFGFAFSDFGKCKFSIPSAYSARTLPSSTVSGSVKLRTNRPYERSIR